MHPIVVKGEDGPTFAWNVDHTVGENAVNNEWDVLFVRWCFYKLSKWDGIEARIRNEFASIGLNERCSGRRDDDLVIAIRRLQTEFKTGAVDGRVSPAKAGHYGYKGRKRTYLIFYLNAALRGLHPQQYPRLDLMPEFAWRLKPFVTRPFI